MLSSIKAGAKPSFIIGIIVIVALFSLALYWLLKKNYQPLFAELQAEDTAVMVGQLDKIEANYRINDTTGALEVPANDVHSTRLQLMSSDIALKGSVGYEVFDNSDFGMTEFAQKINYQRALEGELQRTIISLEQVKYARVHLVMPERELFRENKQEPTASITLLLQDGFALNGDQITGIQRLVSASVPKLQENRVTISDHRGKTLTQAMPSDKSIQMVPWQLQQQINAETYLVDKIYSVLSKAFDNDKISVSVNMEMDFSQVKKIEEKILSAEDGRAISREKESRLGGQSAKKGGQNITKEIEYQMGKSVSEITESPGRVSKLNIGVMLPASLQDADLENIKRLIEVTAGVDETRGDSIAIYTYNADQNTALASELMPDVSTESQNQSVDEFLSESENYIQKTNITSPTAELGDGQLILNLFEKYWIYVAIFALLLITVLLILFFRKPAETKSLSSEDREKVLMQLQHWLSEVK